MSTKELLMAKVENHSRKLIYFIENLYNVKESTTLGTHIKNDLISLIESIETSVDNFLKINLNIMYDISGLKEIIPKSDWEEYSYFDGSSPWDFTLLSQSPAIRDKIRDELQLYVANGLKLPNLPLSVGDIVCCSCCITSRGLLTKEIDKERWLVFNLDTGYEKIVWNKNIFFLPQSIKELPAQTIRCTLSREIWLKKTWPMILSSDFQNAMRKSTFLMKVLEQVSLKYPKVYYVELFAFNEHTNEQVNLTNWFNKFVNPYLFNHNYQVNDELETLPSELLNPYLYIEEESPNDFEYESNSKLDGSISNKEQDFINKDSNNIILNGELKSNFDSSNVKENELEHSNVNDQNLLLRHPESEEVMLIKVTAIKSGNTFTAQIAENLEGDFIVDMIEQEITDNICEIKDETPESLPVIGDLVVALASDNKWHRGIIVGMKETNRTIIFGDYGLKSTVPLKNVKKIKDKYFNIPFQAVNCCFYGVQRKLSHSIVKRRLKELLLGNELRARFYQNNLERDFIEVDVYTSDGESISALLVEEGFYSFVHDNL